MKLKESFFLLFSIIVNDLLIQPSSQNENECCERKIVTTPPEMVGVYNFLRVSSGEKHEECHDACVYSRQGFPDQEYCFKMVPAEESSTINKQCDASNLDVITEETPIFSCPNNNTFIVQTAYNYTHTNSWEQCGNLCYLSKKCAYWT